MSEIKIEKGVPIPEGTRGRHGRWRRLFEQMEIGDSFLVDFKDRKAVGIWNSQANKDSSFTVVTRSVGDGLCRIWKVLREAKEAVK